MSRKRKVVPLSFTKRKVKKEDGRYLILYDFDSAPKSEPGDERDSKSRRAGGD